MDMRQQETAEIYRKAGVRSMADAAKRLDISIATLYRWADKGKIQSVVMLGNKVIPNSEIIRLTNEQ